MSLFFSIFYLHFKRESVKSGGHHCCPCQAPPPPVLVTTSPSARIIRQSSQPEASACCCSGCCCPLHSGVAPSAASLRQLREPGDGIAGIAADSLRINGGIRQFRQVKNIKRAPPGDTHTDTANISGQSVSRYVLLDKSVRFPVNLPLDLSCTM